MIITCPGCAARFVVKAESIGAQGRKVKCTKCSNVWTQEPPSVEEMTQVAAVAPEPQAPTPIPEESNLPALQKPAHAPLWSKVLAGVMAVAILFLYSYVNAHSFSKAMPFLHGYYSLLGVYPTDNMVFGSAEMVTQGNMQVLKGSIVNKNTTPMRVPDVRATLYDAQKNTLSSTTLKSSGAVLEPGQSIEFQNPMEVPPGSEWMALDLGNSLELALR